MAWNLRSYGLDVFEELMGEKEERDEWLAYMARHAKECPAYGGVYLNHYMGWVQFCLHMRRKTEKEFELCSVDVHNEGNCVWTCRVKAVLPNAPDDPMSKQVLVSTWEDEGMAVVELINADILPSYEPGEKIQFQVIAQALQAHYYADEERFLEAEADTSRAAEAAGEERWAPAEECVFPVGFLRRHTVEGGKKQEVPLSEEDSVMRVWGTVKAVAVEEAKMEEKTASRYLVCRIDTEFGELEVVHSIDAVAQEERDNVKAGAVISAICQLSGDVMIYDYDQGIVRDEKNNLMLFRQAFAQNHAWERVRPALDENCHYRSENSGTELTGRDAIIAYLSGQCARMDTPDQKYYAWYAELLSPKCDPPGPPHQEGERALALAQGEPDNYVSVAFLHTNADGYVDDIELSCDANYRFRIFDTWPDNVPFF